jgi:hypothetical protein
LDQIERVAAAIRGLGGEAADAHLKLFGEHLTSSINELPPQLKPRYLREGLRVLGDHPSGERARALLKHYDELLAEIELRISLDGASEVGHDRRFGAHLSIRSTTAVGRESGGFAWLLDKTYSQSTRTEIDYRQDLERELREKLGEAFVIESVRFHDRTVEPRAFGRDGWRETPLAYIVMRTKDPAVDRIPTIKLDLEFNDGAGIVLLPVVSQVVLIDAKSNSPPSRPASDLQVKQTLDARSHEDQPAGAVRLEVAASAKGLVPDLYRLLDLESNAPPGFKVAKIEDHGLDVVSLDAQGSRIVAQSERSWLVHLQPIASAPPKFAFPAPRGPSIAMAYQRYDDADIVDASRFVPLTRFAAGREWLYGGLCLLSAIVITLVLMAFVRNRRRRAQPLRPAYERPAQVTPFSLLGLLDRIGSDQGLNLSTSERQALLETSDELRKLFFERGPAHSAQPELEAVLDRWLGRAAKGRAVRTL